MQLKLSKNSLIIFIPGCLLTYFLYINLFKTDTNTNVQNNISIDNQPGEKKKSNQNQIKPFKLRSIGPESNSLNSIKALTRNPFNDIGSPTGEKGVNLPNNYKFTGIAQVGDKKGVMVSTPIGLEIFYVGQQISKDFKIIVIDSKKAEVILSNGLNKILVKLEKE